MRQVRTIRYRDIADDLRRRMDDGELVTGRVLPSEAELSRTYSASRVTIRKALEELRRDGSIDSRQGFGWFVTEVPVRQRLAHLGTIEAQLAAEGRVSRRHILEHDIVEAPPSIAATLGSERVLRVRRLNLADGEPFAIVTVWCPEELAEGLDRESVAARSFYESIPLAVTAATQRIGASVIDPDDAPLLGVAAGSPVLNCRRVTRDVHGRAVLVGEYVFPANRTEFIVELSDPQASIGPSGLRLVE